MTQVYFYYRDRNQSPLVTEKFLARQRAIMMPGQFAREHQNTVMDAADSFTTVADVAAAMGCGWTEQYTGLPDMRHEIFVDLGAVHDPTVIGVGHEAKGIIYLDTLLTFQGSRDAPVLMPVVKQAILDLAHRFPPKRIRIESWQGLTASQELKGEGLPVELFAPTAKAHGEEWPVLAQRLSSRTLRLFPHARLREELLNLTYEVGPSGVRVIDKGRIHQDHAVVVRGIVAGLSGSVLAPWAFLSEGRWIGAVTDAVSTGITAVRQALGATGKALAPVRQLIEDEPQAYPTHDGHRRSIAEIESLDEGVRSPQEQARLDRNSVRGPAAPFA
jgi:hypothetical protein